MAHDTVPYVGAAFDKSGRLRRPENLDCQDEWSKGRDTVHKTIKEGKHCCQLKYFSPSRYNDECPACKIERD